MWVFTAATGACWPDGKAVVTTLRLAADVPIRRHIKIKAMSQLTVEKSVVALAEKFCSPIGKEISTTNCDIAKIKAKANPFDPAWEPYFEERHDLAMFNTLAGRKKLIRLWFEQQGQCCMCGQRITKETGWHAHHIIRRVDGGSNAASNLMMVHPTCHAHIHNLGSTVVKPAPSRGL